MILTDDQQEAADAFMKFMIDPNEHTMVIGGNAGCGKSTLTKYLLKRIQDEYKLISLLIGRSETEGLEIFITAPTNKAAKVVAELAQQHEPLTTHSLFGLRVINDYKTGGVKLVKGKKPMIKKNSLIIVDEASFVDEALLDAIQSSTKNCKVLFIGDPAQLKSPGKGSGLPVFSMGAPTKILTTVNRNAGPIADLAIKYRDAIDTELFPKIDPVDNKIMHVDGPTFKHLIDKKFTSNYQPEDFAKILAWTNARVHEYNDHVSTVQGHPEKIYPDCTMVTNKPISILGTIAKSSDALVKIKSVQKGAKSEGVSGYMIGIDDLPELFMPYDQKDTKTVLNKLAEEKDWPTYFNIKDSWLDLRPTHACTVHKSQGSTYGTVFIDLNDIGRCKNKSDVARMLYVATSRAKGLVVFYGDLPKEFYGAK